MRNLFVIIGILLVVASCSKKAYQKPIKVVLLGYINATDGYAGSPIWFDGLLDTNMDNKPDTTIHIFSDRGIPSTPAHGYLVYDSVTWSWSPE